MTFDNTMFQARVTMSIDSKYQFPADTEAQILTSGLLGEQYIGLMAGADEEVLESGSKIRRTQSAMVLEQLISKLMYSFVENNNKE